MSGKACVAILAACVLLAGCGKDTPSTSGCGAADPGIARFLKAQGLSGKVVLIQFGLLGCELSERGMDAMIRLHRQKDLPGLAFARVEASPDAEGVEAYRAEKQPGFPVYHDPDTAVGKVFQATAYPSYVLVGKFGRIRYHGRFPEGNLADWVALLAAEAADPGAGVPLFGTVTLDIPRLLAGTKLPGVGGVPARPLETRLGAGGLMVVFVDTSCPFAAQAMRDVPGVARTLAGRKIPVVLINIEDDRETVETFFRKRKPAVPVLYDVSPATKEQWNLASVPTVVLISRGRRLLYNGPALWEKVARAVEKDHGLRVGSLKFGAKGTGFG
jgi:hypothetical protein